MTINTKIKYKVYTDDQSRAMIAKSSHGFMGISVGSHFQSGRRLSAIIDFILKNFDETPFIFYLCDSLKAHNISALKELSLEEARTLAIKHADTWLADNAVHLSKLKANHVIKRWDEFLKTAKYKEAWFHINHIYHNDEGFRNVILQDALRCYRAATVRERHDIQLM